MLRVGLEVLIQKGPLGTDFLKRDPNQTKGTFLVVILGSGILSN